MIDYLEKILSYHILSESHIKVIKAHDWTDNRLENIKSSKPTIFCSKCLIGFGPVLYSAQRANSVLHELTCEEIQIKNILE